MRGTVRLQVFLRMLEKSFIKKNKKKLKFFQILPINLLG